MRHTTRASRVRGIALLIWLALSAVVVAATVILVASIHAAQEAPPSPAEVRQEVEIRHAEREAKAPEELVELPSHAEAMESDWRSKS